MGQKGAYNRRRVRQPHKHAALSRVLPEQTAVVLSRERVQQNVLAVRVVRPVDLAPAQLDLARAALAEGVLPEEEQEARAVLVERPSLLLHDAGALDNVHELDLLVVGELGDVDAHELLVDVGGDLLAKGLLGVVIGHAPAEVGAGFFSRVLGCLRRSQWP